MAVKFRKEALKFLQKLSSEESVRVQTQLRQILLSIEQKGLIPFSELDIKKMRGDWEGFYRLRIGKIRIVFLLNIYSGDIEVYTIGFRGDVYK
ncbi:MAG: type II toxin-antitoxin system RelE/ParE family toxin [Pseudanabaenaceae cyanobacterium bins.68]|nr:type II toxin-antitoxin system RelE/ParE family toxin [Pseudanabaenaceae cyanobacterium bins.68]